VTVARVLRSSLGRPAPAPSTVAPGTNLQTSHGCVHSRRCLCSKHTKGCVGSQHTNLVLLHEGRALQPLLHRLHLRSFSLRQKIRETTAVARAAGGGGRALLSSVVSRMVFLRRWFSASACASSSASVSSLGRSMGGGGGLLKQRVVKKTI